MRTRLVLAASFLSTVAVLAWLLWYCRHGFDFTDEGFYLAWMANPFEYRDSATQFGFIYRPLFILVDGNIALLRQCNILISVALAWMMTSTLLGTAFEQGAIRGWPRFVVSGLFATTAASSLLFGGMWLPTPSYNSLTLQALMVAGIGLMLAQKGMGPGSLAGWLLVGVGGWLAFMAKPTTCAVLAILSLLYLSLAGKLHVRMLLLSLVTALLLLACSALVIDGSISGFIARLAGGAAMPAMLGVNVTVGQLLRLENVDLGIRGRWIVLSFTVLVFAAAWLLRARQANLSWAGAVLCCLLALLVVLTGAGVGLPQLQIGPLQGLALFSVPFATVLLAFFTSQANDLSAVPRNAWALGLVLLLFPYAYAFGTGNNYWVSASCAGIFWVLAGLVVLWPAGRKPEFLAVMLALGLGTQLVVVVLVHSGLDQPYRQPQSLRDHNYRLDVGRPGSALLLSQGFGHYLNDAIEVARRAGLKQGAPMIDLSGRSPGLLYALGARSIGQAWTLGGYAGSDRLAAAMLQRVPCTDLAVAWVLVEPEGLGRISPDVLSSYGAVALRDFHVAGSFMTAPGAGSHMQPKQQSLLKPLRSVEAAVAACMQKRRDGS